MKVAIATFSKQCVTLKCHARFHDTNLRALYTFSQDHSQEPFFLLKIPEILLLMPR